ncbi:MAG: hypothetical protein ACTS8S_00145 [Giesbergeria sp.]
MLSLKAALRRASRSGIRLYNLYALAFSALEGHLIDDPEDAMRVAEMLRREAQSIEDYMACLAQEE